MYTASLLYSDYLVGLNDGPFHLGSAGFALCDLVVDLALVADMG